MSLEESIAAIVADHVAAAEKRLREEFVGISSLMDKTLDVTETAAHIGVSEKLIYRLCNTGSIPHERYGVPGSRRPVIKFRLVDLEAWRAEQRLANCKRRDTP